ncbi:MAG: DUF1998 domain-containing protein [Deltaproteobacteria bacterium]|nr:DUF1998 domain-containing protein [Deltaproteobacteria bacterium]
MSPARQVRPCGQIRQSQIVTTFGPGAMVDLPDQAVVIGGLEHWRGDKVRIYEERLGSRIQALLGLPAAPALYAPPVDLGDPRAPASGITAWLFPEWFVSQFEVGTGEIRTRRLLHRRELVDGKHLDRDRKKHPVVPVRFVQACVRGHLSDIDWHGFVHQGRGPCRRELSLEEQGTSGDLADVYVRCECGAARSLAQATRLAGQPLGGCRGERPWLGPMAKEPCSERARFLIRSASNAYFPQRVTAISIPDRDAALRQAVDRIWEDFLQYVESAEDVRRERRKAKVADALGALDDELVFAEIGRRKQGLAEQRKGIKQAEIEMLLSSEEEIGQDVPGGEFYARALPLPERAGAMRAVERVVLVHRLREVVAQIGFTRFEDPLPDVDAELKLQVEIGALGRESGWLPAVENRGEGVFVAFRQDAIAAWLEREAVKRRGAELAAGFAAWASNRPGTVAPLFPDLPFIMLHSLAHLLITSVSLECGYAASSIRERIYSGDSGYGILLYTGSPDAEGTLGGLVQVGRRLADHLRSALELGQLCSNDPVCAQHRPDNAQEGRFLHGAACHGCLLIAEPSCERRNELLDRALVVPTVDGAGAEFFTAAEGGPA